VLYLLDANILITAHNQYYPLDTVPEFWAWLRHVAVEGKLKIPLECYEEIKDGGTDESKDLLFAWINEAENKAAVVLAEEVDPALVATVIEQGYANDLSDDEVEQLGRVPFLIAYALVAAADRCVVTNEVSKPTRIRQNRHIPDVCNSLGISWCNTFALTRVLGFKTSWKP
jgi:hypothetical protein